MGFMKELQGQKMVSNIFSTAKSTNFSFIFLYQILYELNTNMARKPEVAESNLILEKISFLALSLSLCQLGFLYFSFSFTFYLLHSISNEAFSNYVNPAGLFLNFRFINFFQTRLSFCPHKQDKEVAPSEY